MNLTLDIGNTAVKWATFEGRELVDCGVGMPDEWLAKADHTLACASGNLPEDVAGDRREQNSAAVLRAGKVNDFLNAFHP